MRNMSNLHPGASTEDWKNHTILIVDDEPLVLDELQTILELDGFSVITTQSGEEGLERLKETSAQLVISDQRMPTPMNGTEFLAKVKERYPDTLTMILSAFSEPEYLMDAVNEAGVFQYLMKPWDQEKLLSHVSKALQLYNEQVERRQMAKANAMSLQRLASLEKFSFMGELSTWLYEQLFPLVQAGYLTEERNHGVREKDLPASMFLDRNEWIHMGSVVSRLGQLANYYHEEPEFTEQPVLHLVQNCVTEAKNKLKEMKIPVEWIEEYEENQPTLLIQSDSFVSSIKALIENAVIFNDKAQAENPRKVRIKIYTESRPGQMLCIEVKDNGPGIRGCEEIFSPLYSTCRRESSRTVQSTEPGCYNFGVYNHLGVGLTLARWCITQHDGSLELTNPGEEGALFKIKIPVEQYNLRLRLGLNA